MYIRYYSTDLDDTLSLSTGEVFFLSVNGTGARLSCPMDDHHFGGSLGSDTFDCYLPHSLMSFYNMESKVAVQS